MDAKERIQDLVNLLMDSNIRQETKDRIRAWFAEEENREGKDTAMEVVFMRMVDEEAPDARAYALFRKLSLMMGIEDPAEDADVVAARKRKRLSRRRTWLSAAAVLIPLFVVGGYFAYKYVEESREMLVAVVGENEEAPMLVELPDGSQVWMNSSSRMSYPRNFLRKRVVELEGEAYFEVVGTGGRPFSVSTDHLDVTVLGTEFNLKSYAGEEVAEVRLHTGKVDVKTEGDDFSLEPLQQLILDTSTGEVAVEEFDPNDIDDWRKRETVFSDQPFGKVLSRICRHYGVVPRVSPDIDQSRLISMVFDKKATLGDALLILGRAYADKIVYEMKEDTLVLTKELPACAADPDVYLTPPGFEEKEEAQPARSVEKGKTFPIGISPEVPQNDAVKPTVTLEIE